MHNSDQQQPDDLESTEPALLREISAKLMAGGRDPADPVAVVARATLPDQSVTRTTLAEVGALAASGRLPTPAIVAVGPIVDLRDRLHWFDAMLAQGPMG